MRLPTPVRSRFIRFNAMTGPEALTDEALATLSFELQCRLDSSWRTELRNRLLVVPGPEAVSSRKREWAESRRLTLELLEEWNLETKSTADLKDIHLSISHCRSACFVASAALPAAAGWLGWGVDVEEISRAMSAAATTRVIHPEEIAAGWLPIQAWTVKEACFKATPPGAQTLSEDVMIDSKPGEADGRAHLRSDPALRFIFECRKEGEHWLALSVSVARP